MNMRYHGGKTRIGKSISEKIQFIIDNSGVLINGYIEPFCGMCGVFVHVVHKTNLPSYIASDNNASVIKMWEDLRDGWRPDIENFNKTKFIEMKGDGNSSSSKGFFGHAMTFGALYFQCYRQDLHHLLEYSMRDIVKRSKILEKVEFRSCDYKSILTEKKIQNKLIFCDPPYETISRYYDEFNNRLSFDSDEFWILCENMSKKNIVVISEKKDFFHDRLSKYDGKSCMINLPNRINRFGKTSKSSDEYICVITHLDICMKGLYVT